MASTRPRWEDPAIAALFPASIDEIPARFRIDPKDNPARYQIGDEVITVERDELRAPVYSKVALRRGSGDGAVAEPILLGYSPVVGAAEAERAVALAVKAWEDPAEAKKWRRASWETRIAAVKALTA